MSISRALFCLATLMIAGCGGGGGTETLHVSADYPESASAYLYQPTTITPRFDGFKGHSPHCGLASGQVPPGLVLNSNCSITGVPTQVGSSSFSVSVGADDAKGSITVSGSIIVRSPELKYIGTSSLTQGETVVDPPFLDPRWNVPAGSVWSYQLEGGSLPTGLSLHGTSGSITGMATTVGTFSAGIRAVLTTPYGIFSFPKITYAPKVEVSYFSYSGYNRTRRAPTGNHLQGYISQHFDAHASPSRGGAVSAVAVAGPALPAGLSIDFATGTISGLPSAKSDASDYPLTGTVTLNGTAYATTASIGIVVSSPVSAHYGGALAKMGSPFTMTPSIQQWSPVPLPGAVYRYSLTAYSQSDPYCPIPARLNLDSVTGTISGTIATEGSYSCYIAVTVTNNGVTWTDSVLAHVMTHR